MRHIFLQERTPCAMLLIALASDARSFQNESFRLPAAADPPHIEPHVGAHSRAMLLSVPAFKANSFRPPAEAELLSLCVATSTQDACANSEAGPKPVGQDARSKEKDNQRERPPRLVLAAHRATAPALPQLRHPCRRLSGRKGIGIHAAARCTTCQPRLTAAQGPRVEQRAILARTFQKSRSTSKATAGRRFALAVAFQRHHRVRARMARCSTGGPSEAADG